MKIDYQVVCENCSFDSGINNNEQYARMKAENHIKAKPFHRVKVLTWRITCELIRNELVNKLSTRSLMEVKEVNQ